MKKLLASVLIFFVGICFLYAKTFYAEGSNNIKKLALTFDDGPGQATEKILKILEEKNVKATFFMLGVKVKEFPQLAKAVLDAGHEIANHTYRHINFYTYKDKDKINKIEKELLHSGKIITDTLNIDTFLVRFPYGYSKPDALKIAKENNYYVINWTFGIDWKPMSIQEMHSGYKKAIRNGAIFLMHDITKDDKIVLFLSELIDEIKEKGYEVVTVSELLNLKH
jgi:peptidoglycan/xylan/chitin deacetylase (PgdA/CDA1 family)